MRKEQKQTANFTIDRISVISNYLSIQGDIGAGKSTLKKRVDHFVRQEGRDATQIDDCSEAGDYYLLVDEPVTDWNEPIHDKLYRTVETLAPLNEPSPPPPLFSMLELFYGEPKKYAFLFQINAFTSRLKHLIDELSRVPVIANQIERGIRIHIIGERSLRTDRLFFEVQHLLGNASNVEWHTYCAFFETICAHLMRVESAMIYVHTPPTVCAARIAERNRHGESGIPLDYLELLDTKHDEMIQRFSAEAPSHRVYHIEFDRTMTECEIDVIVGDLMRDIAVDLRVSL